MKEEKKCFDQMYSKYEKYFSCFFKKSYTDVYLEC
jgi:hypothetical protein